MGFGVFIEPSGELKASILRWKERVNQELPDQPYCSHLPHCTLIHTSILQNSIAQQEIRKEAKFVPTFSITLKEKQIFWNDESTGGGHTLVWKICQTNDLHNLQLLLAKILKPLVVEHKIPEYVKNNPDFTHSFKLYGFPFIGSHWIPHMTIASIHTDRDHPLLDEFLREVGVMTIKVNQISCWNIEKEKHTLLERISLK
jgi:2'-5' RNA ligase